MANSAALWLPVLPSLGDFGPSLVKGVAKQAERGGKTAGGRFGKAFGAAAATVAGVAAVGTALYGVGRQFDEMTDTIAVSSGATGAELEGLVNSAKNVGTQVPAEFSVIGDSLATLNTLTGATGEHLEGMTGKVVEASRMLGEDASANADKFGSVMQQWQIPAEEGEAKLDALFVSTQKYGMSLEGVMGHLNTYGPVLQNAGFSMEESAALFGQLEAGGIAVSRVMPGLNASFRRWAGEGKNSRDELEKNVNAIRDTEDAQEALAIATDVFGAEGAQRLTTAIRNGTLELDDLTGALGDSEGAIDSASQETMSFAEHWELFKNNILVAIEPLARRVFDGLSELMAGLVPIVTDQLIPAFEGFVGWIQNSSHWLMPLVGAITGVAGAIVGINGAMRVASSVTRAWTAVTTVATAAKRGLNAVMRASPIGLLITGITAVAGVLTWFFTQTEAGQELWQTFTDALGTAWDWVTDKVGGAATWLWEDVLSPFFSWVGETWDSVSSWVAEVWHTKGQPIWDALGAAASWVWENVLQPFFSWLGEAWSNVTSWIAEAWQTWGATTWDAIASTATWLWENVLRPVFGFISTAWEIMVTAITWAWENVLRPAWDFLAETAVWLWRNVLQPVFGFIGQLWQNVLTAMQWTWQNVLLPVWRTLSTVATWLWENILRPVFRYIGQQWDTTLNNMQWAWENILKPTWDTLVDVARWLWNDVLEPVFTWIGDKWDDLSSTMRRIYDNYIQPVFDAFVEAIEWLEDTFDTVVGAIERTWDQIREVAAKPIKFVIEDVINEGLIKAYNWLIDKLPFGDEISPVSVPASLQGFAEGGHTGPGHKYQPAGIVHAGEYVIQQTATNRLLQTVGMAGLDYMNKTGELPVGYSSGGLVRPITGRVTSGFGASRGRYPHAGIDFAAPIGTPVYAAMGGQVTRAGWDVLTGRTGMGMFLQHDGGRNTYYGHLSQLIASVGDLVEQGELIALSGNTGRSTGPHLHFETWTGGSPVDPAPYLNGANLPAGEGGADDYSWLLRPLVRFGDTIESMVRDVFPTGIIPDAGIGAARMAYDSVLDWAQDAIDSVTSFFGGGTSTRGVKNKVKDVAESRGWHTGPQWAALEELVQRESSWNPDAANPNSTARGLFQKMTSLHGPVEDTVEGQAAWGLNYIGATYGSPVNALAHHDRHNWYADGGFVVPTERALVRDTGGTVPPGLWGVFNGTGRDELMLNHQDALRTAEALRGIGGGGGTHIHGDVYTQDTEEFAEYVESRRRRAEKHVVV